MYSTYIIQSLQSGHYYIGSTGNITDRINRHQQNRSKATKGKGPWKLIYCESFQTRSEAIFKESAIKKRGAGRFLKELRLVG